MSLQTNITNRRQFLERSALGAGSVLFLPGLLASCIDHRIPPDPSTPIDLLVGDDNIEVTEDIKITVTHALAMIPIVGEILSMITELLWPHGKQEAWDKVKEQAEAALNQKIDELVSRQLTDDLAGLNNSITLYLNEVKNGNAASIQGQWISTRNAFALAKPHFQSKGYEVLLLPLFAQFAGLYLTILRDGVISGKSWGRTDADQQQDVADLKKAIQDFVYYTNTTWIIYQNNLRNATPQDPGACEPFRTVNTFVRHMTLTVIEFMDTWAYYDVTLYPTGAKVVSTRAIYSDPYGTCTDSGDIRMETPPTQGPESIFVFGGDRIDAVQFQYPVNTGPGGVTETPRMGNQVGGGTDPPYDGTGNTFLFIAPNNPVVAARVQSSDVLYGMEFKFYNPAVRKPSFMMGGAGGNDSGWLSYPNRFLAQIHINGVSKFYGTADSVVFGFLPWLPPAATLRAVRNLYVTSPSERSAADFAQAFPVVALADVLITDQLRAARQAYWASVQARAKALK